MPNQWLKVFVNESVVKVITELENATDRIRKKHKDILNAEIKKVKHKNGLSANEISKAVSKLIDEDVSDYLFI